MTLQPTRLALLVVPVALLIGAAGPALAQTGATLVGDVVAGSARNEARVLVRNRSARPLENVRVDRRTVPAELRDLVIEPASIARIESGDTGVFTVRFAVAEDAAAGALDALRLGVTAEVGRLEVEEAALWLTVAVSEPAPDASTTNDVADAPLIYVLTEIEVPDLAEHDAGTLGYVRRVEHGNGVDLEAVSCVDCPLRIEPGKAFRVAAEVHRRFDYQRYQCEHTRRARKSQAALSIDAPAGSLSALGSPVLGPTCEDLGIEPGAVTLADMGSGSYRRVPLTLSDGLELSVAFEAVGSESDSTQDRYRYRVVPSSDGELHRTAFEGDITIRYQSRRREPEDLLDDVLHVEVGLLSLTYRARRGDVSPLTPRPFSLPPEFDAPPLDPAVAVAAANDDAAAEEEPTAADADPREGTGDSERPDSSAPGDPEPPSREIPVPTVLVGSPVDRALDELPVGLVPRVQVGSRPPTPAQAGTVERVEPLRDGPLRPGDTVVITVHPDPIELPDGLVGRPVDEVLEQLPAGLNPRVQVGSRAPTATSAGTVEAVSSPQGEPLYPGDSIVITVHPDAIPFPDDLVGLPLDEALERLPAGLVARVEVGRPAPNPQLGGTVERVASADGGALYPGDTVILTAHPEAVVAPPDRAAEPDAGVVAASADRGRTADVTGPGYRLERVVSGAVRPFRLRFKEPRVVEADARGGRAVAEIVTSASCSELVEFVWRVDRDISFLRTGDTFAVDLETNVRGDCNNRDPFATPGTRPSNRSDVYEEIPAGAVASDTARPLESLDELSDGANRVHGKSESGPERRRLRVQGQWDWLTYTIAFIANSGREEFKWQVVYVFEAVDGSEVVDSGRDSVAETGAPSGRSAGRGEGLPPPASTGSTRVGIGLPVTVRGAGGTTFRLRTGDGIGADGFLACDDCLDYRSQSIVYDAQSGSHPGFLVRLSWYQPSEGDGYCGAPRGPTVGYDGVGAAGFLFHGDAAATSLFVGGCPGCSPEQLHEWLPEAAARRFAEELLPQLRRLATPCR